MILKVVLQNSSYDIVISRGALSVAADFLSLDRRVFIVTDAGVPRQYSQLVSAQCVSPHIFTVPEGEKSKSVDMYKTLLSEMLSLGFTRNDCVIAVGGGVVGDLAGFAAATYMRGIDFYNIPTTLLAQVDSSIGGKTALNLDGIKNAVGAFYQPKKVLIDPDVLKTLPDRQFNNGLAESIKMSLTSDPILFDLFENDPVAEKLEEVIFRSLEIKRKVVELDENETGLRRILNFGHTIGHGIESQSDVNHLYHGECVALGMLPMCSQQLRSRLKNVLIKYHLPTELDFDKEKALNAVEHDKKNTGDNTVTAVKVDEPGLYMFQNYTMSEIYELFSIIYLKR